MSSSSSARSVTLSWPRATATSASSLGSGFGARPLPAAAASSAAPYAFASSSRLRSRSRSFCWFFLLLLEALVEAALLRLLVGRGDVAHRFAGWVGHLHRAGRLERQRIRRRSRQVDDDALARDQAALRRRLDGRDAVRPRHGNVLGVRIKRHPGLGVRVEVADLRDVHRSGHAADLGEPHLRERVDQPGVDGLTGHVDDGRTRRNRNRRADGGDLAAGQHHDAVLDHRSRDRDDAAAAEHRDGGLGRQRRCGQDERQRKQALHCAPPWSDVAVASVALARSK